MSRQLQFTVVISFLIVTVEFVACVYSPLLPLIRSMYQVDETWVQMTVSFYLLGLGLAAMLYGPLSDCLGRRPLLLFWLGVFCLANLSLIFVEHLHASLEYYGYYVTMGFLCCLTNPRALNPLITLMRRAGMRHPLLAE